MAGRKLCNGLWAGSRIAGMIHRFSTAATKSTGLAVLRSVGLLNVLQRVRLRWPPVARLVRPALSPLRDENLRMIPAD